MTVKWQFASVPRLMFVGACVLLVACNPSETTKATQIDQIPRSEQHGFKFEIMSVESAKLVDNYYLFISTFALPADTLQNFVIDFRRDYCRKDCNIYLIDDKAIAELVKNYPLEGDSYVKVADHFFAASYYDAEEIDLYPYKDKKYEEITGRRK